MAEDFLPVGIRAVAENVDAFIADVGRMQKAINQLGQSTTANQAKISKSTKGSDAFNRSVRMNASASKEAASASKQLASAHASLVGGTRIASGSIDQLSRNSQAGASRMQILGGAVRRVGAAFVSHKAMTDAATQAVAKHRANIAQLSGSQAQLQANLTRLRGSLLNLSTAYQASTKSLTAVRASLAKYSAELRKSQANLKLTSGILQRYKSQLAGLDQSLASNRGEVQNLNALIRVFTRSEAEAAEKTGQLRRVVSGLEDAEASLSSQNRALGASFIKTSNDIRRQTDALRSNRAQMLSASDSINRLRQTGLTSAAVTKAGAAAWDTFGLALSGAKKGVSGFVGAMGKMHAAINLGISRVKAFNDRIKAFGQQMFRAGNSIRFFGASMTFMVTLPILGFFKSITSAAIDFEEAFAGVIRTVDGADFALLEEGSTNINDLTAAGEALKREIRALALEIPLPAAELAKLGEIAGTLGIRGVGNLTNFIDTAAKLGATTNVSAEVAAEALGKLSGIAGGLSDVELATLGYTESQISAMSASERFQVSIDSLGGVIVALGNKTRAQEDAMLKFAVDIAGVGNTAGLTTKEILTLAASFDAVGVPSSRARTAIQKTFFGMQEAIDGGTEELEVFALAAGQSVGDFAALFEGDAAEAFDAFITGLGAAGSDAAKILDSVGLGSDRVKASLLSLAAAQGTLEHATGVANEELINQISNMSALELEAARRFSTTKSQLQLLKNQFNDFAITVGSIVLPVVNRLVEIGRKLFEMLNDLSPLLIKVSLIFLALVAVIGPLVTGFGLFLSAIGLIITAITTVVSAVLSLLSGLGLLLAPVIAVGLAFIGLAIALAAAITKTKAVAGKGFGDLARSMFDFGKNIILSFARGMARAAAAIITVLNAIGQAITHWLRPGSPPALLPDLDIWGKLAMESYLEGWADADFGIFNKIADKIEKVIRTFQKSADEAGRKNMIEAIIGSRREILKLVNQFKNAGKVTAKAMQAVVKSAGAAGKEVRTYIKALLDLELAMAKLKEISDEMAEVNRRYAASLKPLEDRLKEISRRQEEVSNAMRVGELEAILADPRAPELVRELANLELEEIELEGSVASLEDQRDAELDILKQREEIAKLELDAAQERFDAAEAHLDLLIKERELINELTQASKDAAKSIKDALGDVSFDDIDVGGIDPGELDFGGDFTETVDDIISEINTEFEGLFLDILAIFAPLTDMWDELGDTWAPIFDRIFLPIQEFLNTVFGNPFENVVMPSDLLDFDTGGMVGIGALTAAFGEDGEFAGKQFFSDQHLSGITEWGDRVRDDLIPAIGSLLSIFTGIKGAIGGVVGFFKKIFGAIGDSLSSLDFTAIDEGFGRLMETLGNPQTKAVLEGIAKFFGFGLTVVISGLVALIQGLITGFGFLLPWLGLIVGGVAKVIDGIWNFLVGIGLLLLASVGLGPGMELAWEKLIQGVLDVVAGLGQILGSLFLGIVSAITGFIVGAIQGFFGFMADMAGRLDSEFGRMLSDMLQSIADFFGLAAEAFWIGVDKIVEIFTDLYNRLVGNSIFTDMLNLMLEVLNTFFIDSIAAIATWILEVAGKFGQMAIDAAKWALDIATSIIDGLVGGITGGIGRVVSAAGEIASGIKDKITGFLGIRSPSKEFEEIGSQTIDGLIEGLRKSRSAAEKILKDLSSVMIETITRTMKKMVLTLIEGMALFIRVFAENIKVFLTQFNEAMDLWVGSGESSLWGAALLEFVQMFTKMLELWRQEIKIGLEILKEWIEEMLLLLLESKSDFKEAGIQIMKGLHAGIESMRGAILEAARSIAKAAVNIVNNAVGNASPSKVFFEIGENIMLGWIKGMDSLKGQLVSETAGIAASQIAAGPQALPAMLAPVQAQLPASSVIANNRGDTTIDMGGQTFNESFSEQQLQILVERALRKVMG
jgi:TP901 family phage tail tape measure protein